MLALQQRSYICVAIRSLITAFTEWGPTIDVGPAGRGVSVTYKPHLNVVASKRLTQAHFLANTRQVAVIDREREREIHILHTRKKAPLIAYFMQLHCL